VSAYKEVTVGDLFVPVTGKAKFVRNYFDTFPGNYPVYSASLAGPFGHVSDYEYDGHYLTWVMNGYGGRVQELDGKFSLTRDRGIFIPRTDIQIPDLTYLRFALEPQLMAAAVGRRVDGRLNEYTKIYRDTARDVSLRLLIDDSGNIDYPAMVKKGQKLKRIERAQEAVRAARDPLVEASFVVRVAEPFASFSLDDQSTFDLTIGNRVLRSEQVDKGIPVYSANALTPFGFVEDSNFADFSTPSLLWGIDGNFDWNLVPAGYEFGTTDHCGRLRILDDRIDPEFAYSYLKATRASHGFDRVFRASLKNMKSEISIPVPLDDNGEVSLVRQRDLAAVFRTGQRIQQASIVAIDDVLNARMASES
jgi:hypothetical protein